MTRARFVSTGLSTDLVDEFDEIHVLLAPLVYETELLSPVGLTRIVVPAGFRTDFASVPRVVGAYLMFGGKGKRASVVHDFLYSGGMNVDRETADLIFREALQASGYSAFTVWAMYTGVRVGGQSHFNAPNVPQEPRVLAQMEAP